MRPTRDVGDQRANVPEVCQASAVDTVEGGSSDLDGLAPRGATVLSCLIGYVVCRTMGWGVGMIATVVVIIAGVVAVSE